MLRQCLAQEKGIKQLLVTFKEGFTSLGNKLLRAALL